MTAATGEETEDLVFHVMAFSDCVYLFFFHICSPTLVIFYLRNKQVIKHVCCTQKKRVGF